MIEIEGIVVRPRPNEEPEKLIRRFIKKVRDEGILRELSRRSRFEKPCVKRRRKHSAAVLALKRLEAENSNF